VSAETANDRLRADQIRNSLGDCTIGREIIVFEQTTSTNDAILREAFPSTPEGLVVFAEHQTAGRGQRSNKWESTAGRGLWFSILLRPQIDVRDSARLTNWSAQTVADTVCGEFGLEATVKQPNDIYVATRKIAGVLAELRAQEAAPHFAILGIGINVNHQSNDFSEELRERAASLAMLLNRQVNRETLAIALLRNLDRSYSKEFAKKL
jgi:BirA family biotin operon repressor/biotin-[acetyl-CoA-carboxylase] ligase